MPYALGRSEQRHLDPRTIIAIVGIGGATQLALRIGHATIIGGLSMAATAILVVTTSAGGRRAATGSRVAALGAAICGLLLPLRASGWLLFLNTACGLVLLVAAAVLHSGWRPALTIGSMAVTMRRIGAAFDAPRLMVRSIYAARPGDWRRAAPALRGVALAVLVLVVFGSLLASADSVFASYVGIDIGLNVVSLADHAVLTVVAGLGVTGLVAISGEPPATLPEVTLAEVTHVPHAARGTEATIVLATLTLLFAAFTLVQLGGALGLTDELLATQGVTQAEQARSGYFQLLWVASLTALVLVGVRVSVTGASPRIELATRALGGVVCCLTLLIVITAVVRLDSYTDQFGQTTLRWYSGAFAWMLGVGFALAAAGHHRRLGARLPTALLSLTAVTLVVCNFVNPENHVARHNLTRASAETSLTLDVDYLTRLSADAWPTLLEHRRVLERHAPEIDLDRRCRTAAAHPGWGPLGTNVARARLDCQG